MARRDVGVIFEDEGSRDRMLRAGAQMAASRGGQLHLMRYIDASRSDDAHELGLRSAAAREELADLRAQCRASDPHLLVTDRLHIGPLDSLLQKLEPSIGSLIVRSDDGEARRRLLDACTVPVTIVE